MPMGAVPGRAARTFLESFVTMKEPCPQTDAVVGEQSGSLCGLQATIQHYGTFFFFTEMYILILNEHQECQLGLLPKFAGKQ